MDQLKFDPGKYLTKVNGKDYLEVKYRVLWFRTEYPEGSIGTHLVEFTPEYAVVKATVSAVKVNENGVYTPCGSATGYGYCSKAEFGDYLEKAECISLDTEILTRDGWRRYDQLEPGQEVLAYDPERDITLWVPLQAVTVYEDPMPVLVLENGQGFRARVTPEHTWAVDATGYYQHKRRPYQPPRRLVQSVKLKTHYRIVLAAPCPEGFLELSPEDAARLGWLVTDGTIWRRDGTLKPAVYQSKPEVVPKLQALLGPVASEWMGAPYERDFGPYVSQCLPQHIWSVRREYVVGLLDATGLRGYEDLPKVVTRLRPEARRAMLEAMLLADGDRREVFGKSAKPGVQDAFQILAALEGRSVGNYRPAGTITVQKLKARRYLSVQSLRIYPGDPEPVWCPTTAYGTWVARLPNGFTTITGNTKALGRALAHLGFGTQFAPEIEMVNPDGTPRVVDSPVAMASGRSYGSGYRRRA